jgi:hypothetical protein
MRQIISNDFHDTELLINKTDEQLDAISSRIYEGTASKADKAYRRKLHNALCGSDDCTCGDNFGRR